VIVFVSDLHLHPYRLCSRDGGADRLADGLSCLRQTLELARRYQAAWIFGGDMKAPHTFWPQDALVGALAVLEDFPDVPKYMVPGNHDARSQYGSGLRPFRSVATVVEEPDFLDVQGVGVGFVPWDAVGHARFGSADLIVAHAYLVGVTLSTNARPPGKGEPVSALHLQGNQFALVGDIHRGQHYRNRWGWRSYTTKDIDVGFTVEVGSVLYPGSPYMQNWGELGDGSKGCLLVDPIKRHAYFVPLRSPKYVRVTWPERPERITETLTGHFVQILAGPWSETDSGRAWLQEIRAASNPRWWQVLTQRVPAERSPVVLHGGLSTDEILTNYVAARPPEGLDPAEVLAAGLALTRESDT
jgi:Calcineurin-like phosphoesterase